MPGGAAATTEARPSTRPSEARFTVTVTPTSLPVPTTRKSPDFHRADVIVMRSVLAVGVSGPERAEKSPQPAEFCA
jgi:hypothetical protein